MFIARRIGSTHFRRFEGWIKKNLRTRLKLSHVVNEKDLLLNFQWNFVVAPVTIWPALRSSFHSTAIARSLLFAPSVPSFLKTVRVAFAAVAYPPPAHLFSFPSACAVSHFKNTSEALPFSFPGALSPARTPISCTPERVHDTERSKPFALTSLLTVAQTKKTSCRAH